MSAGRNITFQKMDISLLKILFFVWFYVIFNSLKYCFKFFDELEAKLVQSANKYILENFVCNESIFITHSVMKAEDQVM